MNDKLNLENFDVEALAHAIEDDARETLPGLREGLAELKAGKIGRVHTPEGILIRSTRKKLGLSQETFARRIGTPLPTLRGWEQGRFAPPGSVVRLVHLLDKRPELIAELELIPV
ncbi:MAG: type II toxin-antitoxin system MqsA family antitoxin [Candidatus Accumulibacter sp.]|jgi:putative transcriptional regulator|nr:type II toxin-antitoxin system MqsA family antitoxin [Accumulibacter sp.]